MGIGVIGNRKRNSAMDHSHWKINRDLIIPYRQHTLAECVEIIQQAVNPKKYLWKGKMPEMTDQEKWQGWIDGCLNESTKRLTDWETKFLISISDDLTHTGRLSLKQVEVLERIYTEKV